MAIKLTLSSKQILDTKFNHVVHGYDAYEVDKFLDQIIKDYQKAEANVIVLKSDAENIKGQIEDLKAKIKELEIENAKYKKVYDIAKDNKNASLDNIELLGKIKRYESYIWKSGVNPNTIK